MRLSDLIDALEALAPLSLAESWDNVGLLLGNRADDVSRVLTCLTLTPDVAAEAIDTGVHLVVTHHPVWFKPVQRLTSDTGEGRMLLSLLRHGVAVYSPHTAWDNAPLGINQQLAEALQLADIQPLRPHAADSVKVVTFVPGEHLAAVQQAVWHAGAGEIGNYRCCSYVLEGQGTFWGTDAANPAVGETGRLETVAEARLEVVCPTARLTAVLGALRSAHPYEEPAIDVYPLKSLGSPFIGSGRCGRLPQPLTLQQLAETVRERLPSPLVELVGDVSQRVERVGIACGSAAEFWKDARQRGCQVLVTGEARFHAALEVRDAGFAMLLAGHYATERPGMERLATLLAERCPGVAVSASRQERNPLATTVQEGR